jgi:hypothetical protein
MNNHSFATSIRRTQHTIEVDHTPIYLSLAPLYSLLMFFCQIYVNKYLGFDSIPLKFHVQNVSKSYYTNDVF